MEKGFRDDLAEVLRLQDNKSIDNWVQHFLRGPGGNVKLADTLLGYSDNIVGPIDYPLDKVINIIGPTEEYKFYEDEAELNARVDRMIASIENGWKPAPLILTNIWEENLELADGGHRHRALMRTGYESYHTIIYFRDEESRENHALGLHSGLRS